MRGQGGRRAEGAEGERKAEGGQETGLTATQGTPWEGRKEEKRRYLKEEYRQTSHN